MSALAAAVLLTSCQNLPLPASLPLVPRKSKAEFTQEELRRDLLFWSETVSSLITAAAGEIHRSTSDRTLRRRALLFKVRIIPLSRVPATNPNAQEGYVGVLGLSIALREYLTDGVGANLFGDLQSVAVNAAREIEESAMAIGRAFIDPASLDRLVGQLEPLVRKNAIRGEFAPDALIAGVSDPQTTASLGWITDLPMKPFEVLGGVNQSALAIREFSEVSRAFTAIVGDLPRQLRWQAELLAYDVEDRETIVSARASLESLVQGVHEMTALAANFPEQASASARLAAADARAALADANATLERALELAEPLQQVAAQLEAAGNAWQNAGLAFQGDEDENAEGGEPTRPFDILEYQQTAAEVARAADRVEALVVQISDLAAGPELLPAAEQIAQALKSAEDEGRALVDRATWRVLFLMLAFFALLALYRVLTARLASR